MGTCSACATSLPVASEIAVEKPRLEFRICEYEVRNIASPISSTIACNQCRITDAVIGSTVFTDTLLCYEPLLKPAAKPKLQSEDAVLVAKAEDRDIVADG